MPPTPSGSNKGSLFVLLKFLVDEGSKERTQRAVESIASTGRKYSQAYAAAVKGITNEFKLLASEIKKIEDPTKRQVFTDRFTALRNAIDQQFAATKRVQPQIQQAYKDGAKAVQDMLLEVKNLNEATVEQEHLERQMNAKGFKEAFRYGITGFALSMSGQSIRRFGTALLSPIQKFIDTGTKGDPVWRKWEMSSKRMELSFYRIGKVMAREVLPLMEKAAKLAEQTAAWVEEHPQLAKAVAFIGGGAIGLGTFLTGFGQILSGMAALKSFTSLTQGIGAESGGLKNIASWLGGATLVRAAAGAKKVPGAAASIWNEAKALGLSGVMAAIVTRLKSFGATLLSIGTKIKDVLLPIIAKIGTGLLKFLTTISGAVLSGITLGLFANEQLAKTEAGRKFGSRPAGEWLVSASYGAGALFGGKQLGRDWAYKMAQAFGYIEKSAKGATDGLDDVATLFDLIAQDAIKLYGDYMDQEAKAASKLNQDLAETEAKYEQDRTDAVEKYAQDRADIEENYAKKRADTEAKYEEQRSRAVEDYARDRARKEAEYARDRARDIEDFTRDSAQRELDYQRDRADETAKYQQKLADLDKGYYDDLEKARKDHLRRLRDLEIEHEYKVNELIAARDAIGLADERRRYAMEVEGENTQYSDRVSDLKENLQKERAEIQRDYQERLAEMQQQFILEQQRRQEDFQLKLQQEDEDRAIERQRAEEDFQYQMAQREAQFKEEMAQLDEDEKTKLQDLDESYKDELRQLQEAKRQQFAELRRAYEQERQERATQLKYEMQELLGIQQQGYSELEAATRAYVDNLIAEAKRLGLDVEGVEGKAAGGYVSGLVRTGEQGEEFLMTNATKKMAEQLVGGRLTQSNLLAAMARKGAIMRSGPSTSNIYQRIEVNGYLNVAEKNALLRAVRTETRTAVVEAMS